MLIFVVLPAACTIHVPYDWDREYREFRVVLLVEPDDADVLLDGKFIGEAYEFATDQSALRLRTRNHELVIKKKGYLEEVVKLDDYGTSEIRVRIRLERDRTHYGSSKKIRRREVPVKAPADSAAPAPPPAPAPKPPVKAETEDFEPMEKGKREAVNVTLAIQPAESAIYLNGKFWGIAPPSGRIDNLRLKRGKYTLEIVKPGYNSILKKLTVTDKDINLSFKLQER